ncbi:ankyrin repeat domain-containing protein [Schlesneria sp. T3-172]|uniref:ankyrin repeat domain-containing protein n=1 Tax=Schlesneria sphaerica TaxID=3373610 RepID=UPI0037CB06C9
MAEGPSRAPLEDRNDPKKRTPQVQTTKSQQEKETLNPRTHPRGPTSPCAYLCTTIRLAHDLVLKVLLQSGANPNCVTRPNRETGCFMRDCRTKGETPLHRAAAFGTEETIQLLLDAGSNREAKDQHGDSPLAWASWYARPDSILRPLCYGPYNIRAGRASMAANVLGRPIPQSTGNYGGDDSD